MAMKTNIFSPNKSQMQYFKGAVPSAEMQALPLAPRPQEGGVEGGVGGRPGHGPRVGRVPPHGLHGEVPPVLGGPGHLHLH